MKYSIAIMAHTSRAEHFEYLQNMLKPKVIMVDNGELGVWGNAKRAWLDYDKDCDYHIVIQDDALISKRFSNFIEPVLEKACGLPVSLYFQHKNKYKDPDFNRKIPKDLSFFGIQIFKHKYLPW